MSLLRVSATTWCLTVSPLLLAQSSLASVTTIAEEWSVAPASGGDAGADEAANVQLRPACVPRHQCCRICDNGQACGNWCTKAIFNCAKARGCACDAAKVCKS